MDYLRIKGGKVNEVEFLKSGGGMIPVDNNRQKFIAFIFGAIVGAIATLAGLAGGI